MSLERAKWGSDMMLPFAGKVKIAPSGKFLLNGQIAKQVIDAMPTRFCHEEDFTKLEKEIRERTIMEKPKLPKTSPPLAGSIDFIKGLREGIGKSIEELKKADAFLAEQQGLAEKVVSEAAEVEAIKEEERKNAPPPKETKVKEAAEPVVDKKVAEAKEGEETNTAEAEAKKAEVVAKLGKMNKAALHDICSRAEKPEEEWLELTNAKLVEYIKTNIL